MLAYLYLPSEHTAAAELLLEREPEWAAPVVWRSEFRNTLAGYKAWIRGGTSTLLTCRRGMLNFVLPQM